MDGARHPGPGQPDGHPVDHPAQLRLRRGLGGERDGGGERGGGHLEPRQQGLGRRPQPRGQHGGQVHRGILDQQGERILHMNMNEREFPLKTSIIYL